MMLTARITFCLLLFSTMFLSTSVQAEEGERLRFLLWENGAPMAKGETEKDKPSLTVYSPVKANGCAVVVCPGGGYGGLAVGHEGKEIGEWFNSFGVTAFVLRYRVAPYKHPVPLMDVQRAVRTVRSTAEEWNIDPNRIGVMGFSAGGHLTSTVGTHFDVGDKTATDPIEQTSCRPDFLILCYPVISLIEDFTHRGSRRNLLGDSPDPALVKSLSNETQVTKNTPPTFLFHTTEDKAVPVENALAFYLALKKNGVPAELHAYEKGRHGVGLAKTIQGTSTWPNRCEDWLKLRGFIKSK